MTVNTSRRGFLKGAAAATAVLLIGARPNGALAAGSDATNLNPFVRISADGRVTAIVKHFEMGQGPTTGLTTLIAEELGVTMDQIDYDFAPSNPAVYNNLLFGQFQGTGGSTAMANSYDQYRNAGAAAREMLIAAAAAEWGTDASGLDIVDGQITGNGHAAPLAEFVAAALTQGVPAEPRLRTPDEWRLIGKESAVKRKDTPVKINGSGIFAMDLHLDNQMVVVIAHAPRMGAKVASFDASGAEGMTGFVMAKTLPDNSGVAVYAEGTWQALQAREAITVEWDNSEAEMRSSDVIRDELIAAVQGDSTYQTKGVQTDTTALVDGAATIIDRTFYFPLLAHAPMEPLTCTIEATADGGAILHDGAQFPTFGHMTLSHVLDLPMEKVQVKTVLAGGSFGRRANPTSDYNLECAMAFALTDRSRPVKLVWSREDDIRGGYYRPAFAHRVRVGLDADGQIVGWDHRIAGQSIMKGTVMEPMTVKDGVDGTSVEGVADTPYAVPGMSVGLTDHARATSVLWFRSVGHTHTAYVMESMMDMVAEETGADPLELRLSMLPGDTPAQTRMAGVLREVAKLADWQAGAPEGRARGLAVHHSFGSFVAEIAEVSGGGADAIKIEKVFCAVDCGVAVNPDVIRAQMEGGIGYGIGHVMRNQITLTDGEVDQFNFPDYEPLRISDIGAIEVAVVSSTDAPTGVGEPGVPPAGPALANAIARAGSERVTELPMMGQVDFA
ncbi:molybdopterin cofactor-binding domain-containing protein [Puniceibacterium sp. IMCC21224]|uniref:xanthine dehydrogenase family protein molybdopterin-binding subunit n=1 Tax=Puniceibacterium sp. IMCC21224 TaxID=1618204 RepID=UPI00064DC29B|nr:molybdopterin cofactor-binding domain-containing protein [Puniceibacterium sp. IMCC21224]KMK66430.1 aerobic-type carbon monoxide dehydrogenase, large subunit CoxL/CutL-like protein [Puniceibacterium sp. IMCC21224]